MNISAPSAQSPSNRPADRSGPVPMDPGPDGGSADGVVDAGPTGGPAFGQLFSRTLAKGGQTDVPGGGQGTVGDATTAVGPDGLPLFATTAGLEFALGVDGTALPGGATGRAGKPVDGPPGDKGVRSSDRDADAVGNDLAAQLALVSQWAAIGAGATPAAAAASSTSPNGAAAGSRGLDIKGKLDAIRGGASGTGAPVTGATGTNPAAGGGDTALFAIPGAGSRHDAASGTASGAVPTSTDAVTLVADARARDEAALAAAGEALPGRPDAAALAAANNAADPNGVIGLQSPVQTATVQAAAAPGSASPLQQLHAQVGTPAWSHEVGQATLRMAAGDLQTASLRLNPEHLGPMDVQLRIDNGVAHLAFTAAHAETRQAIEASRATLDRMFADQGITVGDCAVGDSSSRPSFESGATADGSSGDRSGRRTGGSDAATTRNAAPTTVTTRLLRTPGTVDTFA